MRIGGMTCAACVRHVEQALKAAPGVRDAHVNLVGERADLTLGPEADLADLAARVKEAGYEPRLTHVEMGVGGMTCASCVAHVEKALKAVARRDVGAGQSRDRDAPMSTGWRA